MKTHPLIAAGLRRTDERAGIEEAGETLCKMIAWDVNNMSTWARDQQKWHDRRLAIANREVNWPWPGASNVIFPLSDMHVGRVVSAEMVMLLGGTRWCAMRPGDKDAYGNLSNAEATLESMLRGGGVNRLPDYPAQLAYGLDNRGVYGKAIWHPYFDFRTALRTMALSRNNLPGALSRLAIVPDMPQEQRQMILQRDMLAMQQGQPPRFNGPEVLALLGAQEPVQPITRTEWPTFAPRIEAAVLKAFNLDPKDKYDAATIKDIMAYFKAGTPDRTVLVRHKAIVRNSANMRSVHPLDFITPQGTRIDLQNASRVAERFWVSGTELESLANVQEWRKGPVQDALDRKSGPMNSPTDLTSFSVSRRYRPGIGGLMPTGTAGEEQDIYELMLVYHDEDISGDGIPERLVSVIHPDTQAILWQAEYDEADYEFPYIVAPLEHKGRGITDPRGIPEILYDAEGHATACLRTIENVNTLTSGPILTARKSAYFDPESATMTPGEVWTVDAPGDVQQLQLVGNTPPVFQYLSVFLTFPEQLVGTLDIAASQPTKHTEPRTRREVEYVAQAQAAVTGARSTLLLAAVSKLLTRIWNLHRQYGPQEFDVAVTGAAPMRLSQAQITGAYECTAAASVGDMDPNFRYNRALNRFQIGQSLGPVFAGHPLYAFDQVQLAKDVFDADDPLASNRVFVKRPPAQTQQMLAQMNASAQRAQELADAANASLVNENMSFERGEQLWKAVTQALPYKELQQIGAMGPMAKAGVDDATTLVAASNGRSP